MTENAASPGSLPPPEGGPLRRALQAFADMLPRRRDTSPISTAAGVGDFVATRSAFVTQKTLYGYLKTRMGTRYPDMFRNDVFVRSIDIAKFHVYAACAADLAIYAAAHALDGTPADDDARRRIAGDCLARSLAENVSNPPAEFSPAEHVAAFDRRLAATDWPGVVGNRTAFAGSSPALLRWAPVAPELKRYDAEIVSNSIRFAWHEVTREYLARIDPPGLYLDWTGGG